MTIDYRIIFGVILFDLGVLVGYLLSRALQTRPPDAAARPVQEAEHGQVHREASSRDNVTPLKRSA